MSVYFIDACDTYDTSVAPVTFNTFDAPDGFDACEHMHMHMRMLQYVHVAHNIRRITWYTTYIIYV